MPYPRIIGTPSLKTFLGSLRVVVRGWHRDCIYLAWKIEDEDMPEITSDTGPSLELVPVTATPDCEGDPLLRANMLPCRLVLEVPVVAFTVGTLIRLKRGSIVETAAQHNEDLLLRVNGQLVGTVKFDVTRERLAVRLTGVA